MTVALAGSLGLLAACADDPPVVGAPAGSDPPATADAGWRTLPAGPLSPRESAVGAWTGREVLLVGGSDSPPCPPTADCAGPSIAALFDGAAFDPATGAWRSITPVPVPVDRAATVVVDGVVYLWVFGFPDRPGNEPAFLAYHPDNDRWERLELPVGAVPEYRYRLAAVAGKVVAYAGSDEQAELPDFTYDPPTGNWEELLADPLSPAFDRVMVAAGGKLYLFAHELVESPGGEDPSLAIAAVFEPGSGAWRRLPDSEIIGYEPWLEADGLLVNPSLGSSHGGQVDSYGRNYPYGGIFDTRSERWLPLPDPPAADEPFPATAGVRATDGAVYVAQRGWVLDTTSSTWSLIPAPRADEVVTNPTIVAAGRNLFVFGGTLWRDGDPDGELLDRAELWTAPGADETPASHARPATMPADPSRPPDIVLRGPGGELQLTPVSWCAPTACADDAVAPPGRFAQVGPGRSIELELIDATAGASGRCSPYCTPGVVQLQPHSCGETATPAATTRPTLLAGFSGDGETVRLDVPPGSYVLSVFVYWTRPDGTTGDVYATAGIQVDPTGASAIADANEIQCRPPQRVEPDPLPEAGLAAPIDDCALGVEPVQLDDQIARATAVFIGVATGAETIDQQSGIPLRRVRFSVTEPLRGSVPPAVDVAEEACHGTISDLDAGATYLVFAHQTHASETLRVFGDWRAVYLVDAEAGTATNGSVGTLPLQELIDRIGRN